MRRREFCRRIGTGVVAGSLGLLPVRGIGETVGTYVVQRGDTLSEIAREFGTTVSSLRLENGIEGDLIRIGQVLRIPDAGKDVLSRVRLVSDPKRGGLRTWRYIVVHHSATSSGNAEIFDHYHRNKVGMANGLAYHFVIGNGTRSGDGEIEIGSRWDRQAQGGHVRSRIVNQQGIGICLVGNFEKTRPSPRQIASLTALTGYLREIVPNRTRFAVHREIDGNSHTVCPGRFFPVSRMHRMFPDEW